MDGAVPTPVDLSRLAREIAMDILELPDILEMHKLSNEDWETISGDHRFQTMLDSMIRDWKGAENTQERVKVKAATGFESLIESFILDARDPKIPLVQRVEVGKLLVRVGELEREKGSLTGGTINIQINAGTTGTPSVNVVANVPKDITPVSPAIPPRLGQGVGGLSGSEPTTDTLTQLSLFPSDPG